MPALADAGELSVGLTQDPRQPLRQLRRDRSAVAPSPLAGRELLDQGALDRPLAALPDERSVEGDEDDPAAGPVPNGLGVGVGDVGTSEAVAVVGDARDRRVVAAEWGAGEEELPRGRAERAGEARSPGELVAEVMDLV